MMKSKSSNKKAGRVSFCRQASVRRTISRKDFTVEELEAAWFTRDEFIDFKKSCCKQIIKMDNGEILRDKKYCSRGLEGHTRLGSISKTRNRVESMRAVLLEQESQFIQTESGRRVRCQYNPEAISQAYQRITASCQLWASAMGLEDQRTAESYADDKTGVTPAKKAAPSSPPNNKKDSASESTIRPLRSAPTMKSHFGQIVPNCTLARTA